MDDIATLPVAWQQCFITASRDRPFDKPHPVEQLRASTGINASSLGESSPLRNLDLNNFAGPSRVDQP